MGTTPVCTIDATGIHKPAFADVLAYFQTAYRSIYGQDVYLGNDSQDGQWVALIAAGVDDCNAMAVSDYNSYSPATAQGTGLSSVVKTNGITRLVASFSTVALTIIGQFGAVITNGIASDGVNQWLLPAAVTIPSSGQIIVTATAAKIGAIAASAGTINSIMNPQQGWQSVSNALAATPGNPIENDIQLRARQAISTALPSRGILDGIMGAIAAIPGVARFRGYENDGPSVDVNNIPGNCIAIVVDGGDSTAICNAILLKKGVGVGTYGTSTSPSPSLDANGIPHVVRYFQPTEPPIFYRFTIKALPGFTVDVQNQIAQAVVDWTNALGIGAGTSGNIRLTRVFGPALLIGTPVANTFEILSLTMARDANPLSTIDIPIAFNEAPSCTLTNVQFVVT